MNPFVNHDDPALVAAAHQGDHDALTMIVRGTARGSTTSPFA
jgi:hypothetical protein